MHSDHFHPGWKVARITCVPPMFRISTFPLSTLLVSSGESKLFFSVDAIARTSELGILESEAAFITNERGSQHARRVERPPTAPVSTQSWASRELKLTTEAQRALRRHRVFEFLCASSLSSVPLWLTSTRSTLKIELSARPCEPIWRPVAGWG